MFNNFSAFASSSLLAVLATITAMFTLWVLLHHMQSQKRLRIEEKRLSIEFEMMRRSFENKIYDLNERMVSDPDRWSDLNNLIVSGNILKNSRATGKQISTIVDSSLFLQDIGIDTSKLKIKSNEVFVLTPFSNKFDETYAFVRNIISDLGLQVSRGDEISTKSAILPHILTNILEARIIIANIDGRNPNVFYELGIAHAFDKTVILLASSIDSVPFDLRNQRIIIWRDKEELETELVKTVARLGMTSAMNKQ
jgi:hypothetical protein